MSWVLLFDSDIHLLRSFWCSSTNLVVFFFWCFIFDFDMLMLKPQGCLFALIWLLVSTLVVARAFLFLAEARVDKRRRRVTKWVLGQEKQLHCCHQRDWPFFQMGNGEFQVQRTISCIDASYKPHYFILSAPSHISEGQKDKTRALSKHCGKNGPNKERYGDNMGKQGARGGRNNETRSFVFVSFSVYRLILLSSGCRTLHQYYHNTNGITHICIRGPNLEITNCASVLSFKGSPYWMAPEVVMNANGYNIATELLEHPFA